MQVYKCQRCGQLHDFAKEGEGRRCDVCAAPLTYHGVEVSPWGENPHLRDYDGGPSDYDCSLVDRHQQ